MNKVIIFASGIIIFVLIFFFNAQPKKETPTPIYSGQHAEKHSDTVISETLRPTINHERLSEDFSTEFARKELHRILSFNTSEERDPELYSLYHLWMQLDPYDALNYITVISQTNNDALPLYAAALATWARINALAFDSWIKDFGPDPRFVDALERISLDDSIPEHMAIQWVHFITDPNTATAYQETVLSRWLNRDSQEAIQWAVANQKTPQFFRVLFEVLTLINPDQSLSGLALLEGQKESKIVSAIMGIRGMLTFEKITQSLLLSVQTLPTTVRQLTSKLLVPRLANVDDPSQVALFIESLPDNYAKTIMLESLSATWAHNDPQKAAQFALTIPKGKRQAQVLSAVVAQWHRQDLTAASEWLNSARGNNVSTDRAAHHLASHAANLPEHVGLAAAWVNRIEDKSIKLTTAQDVTANWFMHDEDSAEQFLVEQGLLSEDKLAWFINDQRANKLLIEKNRQHIEAQRNNANE